MSINRVVLVGNLTRDPEMKSTAGGLTIMSLRLAFNERRRLLPPAALPACLPDAQHRRGLSGKRHLRECMTHIAFKAYRRLVIRCKVFAVVTAEAAGPILVSDIVRMCRPTQVLGREY